jgi:hypothetical protein
VATTRGLLAAATVAGRAANITAAEVFAVADRIRPLGTGVPALAVGRVVAGEAPTDVVVHLLRADRGEVPELAGTGRSRQLLELLLRGLAACGVVYFHHTATHSVGGTRVDVERDEIFDRFRRAVRAEMDRYPATGQR